MKGNEKKMRGKWKELKIAPQNCEPPCANFSKKILMKISAFAKHPELLRFIKQSSLSIHVTQEETTRYQSRKENFGDSFLDR